MSYDLTRLEEDVLLAMARGEPVTADGDPLTIYQELEAGRLVEIVRFYGGYRVQLTRRGVDAVHELRHVRRTPEL